MTASPNLRVRVLAGFVTLALCTPALAAEAPSRPLESPSDSAGRPPAAEVSSTDAADYAQRAQGAPAAMEDFTGGSTVIIGTTAALVVLGVVLLILIL
jgi:hypothetical protein